MRHREVWIVDYGLYGLERQQSILRTGDVVAWESITTVLDTL
jgi:hypothetical protein